MPDTWLIIHLHGDVHVCNLGEIDDDDRDDAIMAARALVDFPADDSWAATPELTWQKVAPGVPDRQVLATAVMVSFGQPHDDLMNRARVWDREDLANVAPDVLAKYKARYAENVRKHQVESLAAQLSGVDPDVLAAALIHPRALP